MHFADIMELTKWTPIANLVVTFAVGAFMIQNLRDALGRFEKTLGGLEEKVDSHSERLARMEATCSARGGMSCVQPVVRGR
jgi:hypothetical protein